MAGAYYPRIRASLGITPQTPVTRFDRAHPDHADRRVIGVWIADELSIQFHDFDHGDAGIVAVLDTLIGELEVLRDAARDRVAEAQEHAKLLAAPPCDRCGAPAIDHEDQAGGCPESATWYVPGDEPNVVPAAFPDLSGWAPAEVRA